MLEVLLAVSLLVAAGVAWRSLTTFHPATLWLLAWGLSTTLFALHALPYRPLSGAAAALVAGWTAVFCLGTLLGSRMRLPASMSQRPRPDLPPRVLATATVLASAMALVGLGAFLLQIASSYGLRSALVSDQNVRLAIGAGATPITIKYIYAAFAATTLAAITAGTATTATARRSWLAVAGVGILIQYFSTGRSNLFLAAVMACIGYCLSSPRSLSATRALLVAAGVAASTLVVFTGMGSLLDKSFRTSDIRTYDNVFLRHEALRPMALPYQYLASPLPAFDVVRSVTPTTGRGGCMTLSPACSIGAKLGLPVQPEPSLSGFTGAPNRWNTFTALYAPMVDGGPLLGAFIMLAEGVLFGLLWALTRTGSIVALGGYAAMSAAVVYSTIENTLLQPHLVGAALIVAALIIVAARLAPRLSTRAGAAAG